MFAAVCLFLPCSSDSADATEETGGKCGENVYWNLNVDTGELIISGTGKMTDYTDTDAPWMEMNVRSLTIEEGVESIGVYAFDSCDRLVSVSIPDSVTLIGYNAFGRCPLLADVHLGNGVTNMESDVFSGCPSLTSLSIPDSVTEIGSSAFDGCSSLISINIPNISVIESYIFRDCKSLKSITIPDSVTEIGDYAFKGCKSLTSVYIGSGAVSLGEQQFATCISLTFISVSESNENYSSDNGVLFSKDMTELIQYPIGKTDTEYTIPENVKIIDESAFKYCSSLNCIRIPDSVTEIGRYAFEGCLSLSSVTIGDGIISIGISAFERCISLKSIIIPGSVTSIESCAFNGCTSLESISVDGSNKNYRSDNGVLFTNDGTKLIQYPIGKVDTSYIIRDGVSKIDDGAFKGCKSLVSITIPGSVKSIGVDVFFLNENRLNQYQWKNPIKYTVPKTEYCLMPA